MANIVTIKALTTWRTDDGGGFQATLVVDKKPVAQFTNAGQGGIMEWDVTDAVRFAAWAKTHGVTLDGRFVPCDTAIDIEVARLVDEWEHIKRFTRLSKTKTIFRLPTDADGEWRTVTAPLSDKVRAYLSKTHPTAILWTKEAR
jgi:hypothetical protein